MVNTVNVMDEVKILGLAFGWLIIMLLYLEYIKIGAGRDLRRRKNESAKGREGSRDCEIRKSHKKRRKKYAGHSSTEERRFSR